MSWDTSTVKASIDGTNSAKTAKNTSDNVLGSITKKYIADVNSCFTQTSVVGINVNAIPNMKNAIMNYVNDIHQVLSRLQNYDPRIAFQGEQANALMVYIEDIKNICSNVCSNMYTFVLDLDQIRTAYETKDVDVNATIRTDSATTKSAFDAMGTVGIGMATND